MDLNLVMRTLLKTGLISINVQLLRSFCVIVIYTHTHLNWELMLKTLAC